jgi:hypothetical protein
MDGVPKHNQTNTPKLLLTFYNANTHPNANDHTTTGTPLAVLKPQRPTKSHTKNDQGTTQNWKE